MTDIRSDLLESDSEPETLDADYLVDGYLVATLVQNAIQILLMFLGPAEAQRRLSAQAVVAANAAADANERRLGFRP